MTNRRWAVCRAQEKIPSQLNNESKEQERKQKHKDIKQLTQGHLNLLEEPKVKPMCCAPRAHAEPKTLPCEALPEEIWQMQRLHPNPRNLAPFH